MGFDDAVDAKMLGLRMAARHRRSKSSSFPDKRRVDEGEDSPRLKLDMGKLKAASESKKRYMPAPETRTSLKREILLLEKRLQEQFRVRQTLSRALGSTSTSASSYDASETTTPKPATELIKEIAALELEVVHLEQYLLSLYRKAFDQQVSSVSPTASKNHRMSVTKSSSPAMTPRRLFVDDGAAVDTTTTASSMAKTIPPTTAKYQQIPHSGPNLCSREQYPSGGGGGLPIIEDKNMIDSSVHRCYSTLSHRTGGYPAKTSSPTMEEDPVDKALRSCHSQPLSMMMYAQNTASSMLSLGEHLGTQVLDQLLETPNRIAEEMVKLMAAIFSKLSDPPSCTKNFSSSLSPNSSSSSTDEISPQYRSNTTWSLSGGSGRMDNSSSSFEVRLDNDHGLKEEEFSRPYSSSTMVEVGCIYRDRQKWSDVEDMLQSFRSLISRLQEIDPKKMNQEEKLAFWINVHNALVMHAFLAYGIPQSNMKRVFLLLKAAYNVGGRTVSADTIQSIILGCRMSRPGQWIRMIISPKTKFKTADDRQAYSIDHPEPLLHFALCCGSHSDPPLRVYTPKRVYQELESAKEEYIRATFGVRKDKKAAQLPKLVESYAKDAGLGSAAIIAEMIQQSLPDSVRKTLKKTQLGKSKKGIEWMPHNFSFRYLISQEVVKGAAAVPPG